MRAFLVMPMPECIPKKQLAISPDLRDICTWKRHETTGEGMRTMKARLLENRTAYAKTGDRSTMVNAGEVVEIIRIEQFRDRMVAEYKGLYTMSLTPDQAEPIDEDQGTP